MKIKKSELITNFCNRTKMFLLLIPSTSLYVLTVVSKFTFLHKKAFKWASVWLNERIPFIGDCACSNNNNNNNNKFNNNSTFYLL